MQTEQMTELEHRPELHGKATGSTTLSVTGMTCGNCARHITEAIQRVPEVQNATVNLDAQEAIVRWRSGAKPETEKVIRAIEEEGFGAKIITTAQHDHAAHLLAGWRLNLLLGIPVTALLMAGEWLFGLGTVRWFQWCSFALATFVQVFAGARFYRGAWSQAKAGSSNMDTLVALGSTTAFGFSIWALLTTPWTHLYFMEASAIITLISVGHWLESRVSQRASSALRHLLNLAPTLTRRINAQGVETEAEVASLKEGELVALRPGDHVPTDGKVEEGHSTVNESMLTGESAPVDKRVGSELYAGTVNLSGRLVMRVTATGEETALAHVIAAVQRAQNSRAQIQRIGDRVSSVFVPVVIAVALMAGLWWGLAPQSALRAHDFLSHFFWPTHPPAGSLAAPFIIAAAVLIIACPCAMGLATPAAIMAGSNAAAQRGILIRDGIALEKAGQITTVLLDKTGTLTLGRLSLVKQWELPEMNFSQQDGEGIAKINAQSLASALARHSSHPISQAIANFELAPKTRSGAPLSGTLSTASTNSSDSQSEFPTKSEPRDSVGPDLGTNAVELVDWEEVHGAGVQGKLRHLRLDQGSQVWDLARLGSLKWLIESGVDLGPGEDFVKTWSSQGATIVGVALNGSLLGLFAISDSIKPGARQVVEHLQRQGFQTYLVTGDNALTATTIAAQAGIPPQNVLAEVRPEQKAQFVQKLQQQGNRVAFVGDGINDAPALEQADLGIAVGRASDIAREAADIILLKSEIEAVPESLGLARATLRTIKQNLFWAFFYNVTGIPLAALGFMSPVLCAAAMGLSDLVVLGNALRLRRWRL